MGREQIAAAGRMALDFLIALGEAGAIMAFVCALILVLGIVAGVIR